MDHTTVHEIKIQGMENASFAAIDGLAPSLKRQRPR